MRRRTEGLYDHRTRERDPADFSAPRRGPVPLEGGVFEVFWTGQRTGPGVIEHRQYLRVVESGARLRIDTSRETID